MVFDYSPGFRFLQPFYVTFGTFFTDVIVLVQTIVQDGRHLEITIVFAEDLL